MAKAGQFEDLHPAANDVGGFKRVHVSHCNNFNVNIFGELNWFVSLQGYNPTTELPSGLVKRTQFNCPYRWQCKCYVALSAKEYSDMLQAGEHTMSSHEKSSSILNPKQKGAVERAARSAPLASEENYTEFHKKANRLLEAQTHRNYTQTARYDRGLVAHRSRRNASRRLVSGLLVP
jgi:hypothetical protein